MLKTCTTLIVAIFERFGCFDEVFLMALTSTEQLFIETLLCRRFLHRFSCIMINYPISSNLCKKTFSAMLSALQFFIFQKQPLEFWRCSVRKGALGNFAKFTGTQLWQSLFFNKVTGWGDCFWSFLCLLLKISCLFHLNRKVRRKKGNTLMEFKYLLFCFVWRQIFEKKIDRR